MLHIYYGDGKGKTTAAIGLAIRAAGQGHKVLFVQFLKSDYTGERKILETINNITLTPSPVNLDFTFNMTSTQKAQTAKIVRDMFEHSVRSALIDKYNVLILDEIFSAINEKMLSESTVYEFLTNAPANMEIIMTGHNPPDKFIKIADYVSNIQKVKHPYDNGIQARSGIEY